MKISVITPTYNRADLLKKAYDSLVAQECKEFEWLVVDDGSKDNTREIVENFIKEGKISIIYLQKENGGKHTAVNLGVSKASGELTMILDSDDMLTPDAIATILKDWEKYISNEKICGLSYNRKILNSNVEVDYIKEEEIISNHIMYRYNKGNTADREEVHRTSILKEYPFLVIEGERFLSEAVVWNKIAYKYDTVYINKYIYICEYLDGGLTSNSIKTRVNNPRGAIANYEIMMGKPFKLTLRIKYSILYNAFCKFANIGFHDRLNRDNKFLIILTKFFGDIVYSRWKKYLNK